MASGSSPEEDGYLAEVDTDQSAQDHASQDANASASSTEGDHQDANDPKSILEAVQAAAKTDKEEPSSSSDQDGEDGEDADPDKAKSEDDKSKDAEAKEGEEDQPPFHKHPRWKEVQQELKDLRPKAEMADQLQGYMQQAGLSVQEVNAGFELMNLMKNDPAKALEQLQPYVQSLQSYTGERLPDDLRQDVEDGYITEERAKELARYRNETTHSKARAEQAQQETRQQQAQRQSQDISSAVSDWERSWQQSDPDYATKQARVLEKIELKMLRGSQAPQSSQDAIKLCEDARKEVEQELSRFRPQKRQQTPVSGQAQVASNPEPQSMQDAMRMAARGEYQG